MPESSGRLLDMFEVRMLRSLQQLLEFSVVGPVVKRFMDPVLSRNHGKYVGFVRELFGRGFYSGPADR